MRNLPIALLLLFSYVVQAQDPCHFESYYSARYLFKNKNFDKALIRINEFLNSKDCGLQKDQGYLLKCRILSKKDASNQKVQKVYKKAIKYGLLADDYLKYEELKDIIKPYSESKKKKLVKAQINSLKDLDYYTKIINMIYFDQAIRMDFDTIDDNSIWTLDTINLKKFYNLIKSKKQLPIFENVGNIGMFEGYVMLLHLIVDGNDDKAEFQYLEPRLLSLVKKGKYPPMFYVNFVDRYYVFVLDEFAPFGTFNFKEVKNKKEYDAQVKKKRAEIHWPIFVD